MLIKEKIAEHLTKPTILICRDEQIKKSFIRFFQDKFCFSRTKYLTVEETINIAVSLDKVLLLGEKRVVAFYHSLSDEVLEHFDIRDYHDCYLFSYRFFEFFEELQDCDTQALKNTFFEKTSDSERHLLWQKEQYKYLTKAKEDYRLYLLSTEYTDKIFMNEFNVLNLLKGFEQVVYVGIDQFSCYEYKLFESIEKNINTIKIFTNKEEETRWSLQELEIFRCSSDFAQAIDLANNVDRESYDVVIDLANNSSKYAELLDFNKFDVRYSTRLSSSKVFSVLKGLETLCVSLKQKQINGFRLEEVISNYFFREYYDIPERDVVWLRKELNNNRIFFDASEISLKEAMLDVAKVSELKTAKDLSIFIQGMKLEKLLDTYFDAVLDKLLGQTIALSAAFKDFDSYKVAQIKGVQWVKILTARCEHLELVFEQEAVSEKKIRLLNWENAWVLENKKIVLLNATENILSSRKFKSLLFTEQQKKALGLKTREELLLEKKELFFELCAKNEKVRIYTIEDSNGVEQSSSFVDELAIVYKGAKNNKIGGDSIYSDYLKYFQDSSSNKNLTNNDLIKFSLQDMGTDFVISYSSYQSLKACPLKFYLEKVIKLKRRNKIEETQDIKPEMLGLIVHSIFEKVCKTISKQVGTNVDFHGLLKKMDLQKIIKDAFDRHSQSLPEIYHRNYVEDVVFSFLEDSVKNFFEKVCKENFEFKDIVGFFIEDTVDEAVEITTLIAQEGQLPVKIVGRADLRIELRDGRAFIFDFKTGSQSKDIQLNFYREIYYSGTNEYTPKLIFYKVFEAKAEEAKNIDIKEKIDEVLATLVGRNEYEFHITSEACRYCSYEGICRRNG